MADAPVSPDAKGAAVLAVTLAVLATLLDDGTIGWLVGPVVFVLLVFAMARAPLRYSLFWLMVCNLVLENPTDLPAAGAWKSPLYNLGALMLAHMNQTTGQKWMFLGGAEVLVYILCGIAIFRRATGSKIDSKNRIPSPKILRRLAFLSLAGTAFVWIRGMLRGGDFSVSLWQVEKVVYIPIVFLLFDAGLRGPKDFITVGRIVLVAAFIKACMAIYVMNFLGFTEATRPQYATTHHDSLLFACAIILLISLLLHRARANAWIVTLLVAPILLYGMVENNRRMVWVQIGLVLIVLFFSMPPSPVKRGVKRWALRTSPLSLAYLVVGWNAGGGIFKPVKTIRSVVEPANDVSTMTRDIENYNIAQTIRTNPILGTGYGHGYWEQIPLPPMPYPLERFLPHNSLLGLWFVSGFIGYTMMTLLWTAGVYFGVRAYRAATKRMHKAASMLAFGTVLMYLIQCYGDLGLGAWPAVYLVSPALAIAGKLAVLTGAWPAGRVAETAPVVEPLASGQHPDQTGDAGQERRAV